MGSDLPVLKPKEVVKILNNLGFELVRQKEMPPESVSQELLEMAAIDQEMRIKSMNGEPWDSSVDDSNTKSLKDIISKYGWPTISSVGVEASQAAWLIAQHADHDIDFQAQCLEMMRQLEPQDVSPTNRAYLEDRVRVNQGKAQIYGTQFNGNVDKLEPQPIEDEEHLDERRASVGLGPFKEYRKQIEEMYQKPKT